MNTTSYNVKNQNLRFLENLDDYKVHHDDIDPRGFTVKLSSGETIGKVEGLLADVSARKVRYVEVEVDDKLINTYQGNQYTKQDRHLLLPVGIVRIDADQRSVSVNDVSYNRVSNYPRFNREHGYTTGYEIDVNDHLSEYHPSGSTYQRDHYSTDDFRSRDRLDDKFYEGTFYENTSYASRK